MIHIHLKKTDGFQFDLDVTHDTTIEEIKDEIGFKFDIPIQKIILIFKGQKMINHYTIALAGIHDGDSVYFVFPTNSHQFEDFDYLSSEQKLKRKSHSSSDFFVNEQTDDYAYFKNKHIHTKQQLNSLDTIFFKVESSRKASLILQKCYANNTSAYENYMETFERKFKTVVPSKPDNISEKPLPTLFGLPPLPKSPPIKCRPRYKKQPLNSIPQNEEGDENSSFKVPL